MVTGEYHNKILMALYTHLHVLNTQVHRILLHNGNKNTDTENMGPDNTLRGFMFLHRPCLGTAPLTLPLTYALERSTVCISSVIVSIYESSQKCLLENKNTKWIFEGARWFE